MPRCYLTDVKILADNLTPYQTEPVTADDVKLFLQLEGMAYDAALTAMIKAARKKIEKYCNVSLVAKSILASFRTVGLANMSLPFPPLHTMVKVEWKKCPTEWLELVADDDYSIENDASLETEVVSSEIGLHRIQYTTYPIEDIEQYAQAIIIQAAAMYTHRDDATFEWSPAAKSMLDGSRLIGF